MPEHLSIPTAAGRFDAIAAGSANGRGVLLLHGFPQGAIQWDHQLKALAGAGYRAVAPDQRGYSPNVRPTAVADYQMKELVADVLRIADGLGWERFDLVGHDWGAAVAWVVADQHPERLRSLTAVSVPHPRAFSDALRSDEDQRRRSAYMELFYGEGDTGERFFLDNDAAGLKGTLGQAVPPERLAEYVARLSRPGAMTAALNWYRATRPDEVEAGAIALPTLYVWSTEDLGVGETAALGTGAWVSGPYRFARFEGVSHRVPEEAATRLSAELLDHLERNGR